MTNVTSRSHISEIWIFEVIFVDFRLMKNVIFNTTESFVGRNTSNHARQITSSKSTGETMYHWFFPLEIAVVKIMNNLNVCSANSYSYPRSRLKGSKLSSCWHFYRDWHTHTYHTFPIRHNNLLNALLTQMNGQCVHAGWSTM
jgi:hypothetical protein